MSVLRIWGPDVQFFFADHTLDTDRRELRRGSERIAVEPQVFDLLVYLVQNRDRVVTKDDLIASVWRGRIVSDSTLTSRINAARKAVGDSGEDQRLIRTIARKGLRFVGGIHTQPNGTEPAPAAASRPDEIQEPSRPALPLPDRPAIAVLPFVNMSGDPEQEYFSDGISEDIITALSKLRCAAGRRNPPPNVIVPPPCPAGLGLVSLAQVSSGQPIRAKRLLARTSPMCGPRTPTWSGPCSTVTASSRSPAGFMP